MKLALFIALASAASVGRAQTDAADRAQFCTVCHRPGYTVSYVPTLEGQTYEYLFNRLRSFKEGRGGTEGHRRYWGPLTEKDVSGVARYFSSKPRNRESFAVDPQKVAAGRSKAKSLSCESCHAADYAGKEGAARLAGLHPQYAAAQIVAFTEGKRRHPRIGADSGISAGDAEALGQYFAQLQ